MREGRWGSIDGLSARGEAEHAVKGEEGVFADFGMDADDVDGFGRFACRFAGTRVERAEVIECPEEVGFVDAVHGCAEALAIAEDADVDVAIGTFAGDAVDEVNLGSDGPPAAGRGLAEGIEDVFGAAGQVGLVDDFFGAFRVNEDGGGGARGIGGVGGADLVAVFGAEEFVHGAMAGPEYDTSIAELFGGGAAEGIARAGAAGVVEAGFAGDIEAEACGGVAAEVLIGQEEDSNVVVGIGVVAPVHGPGEDAVGVGTGAAGPAASADKGLDGGGGVDVGDGDDARVSALATEGFVDEFPGVFGVVVLGHVGHGAPGGEVGEDDAHIVGGEHVGGFGHEVDAAEDDVSDGSFGGDACGDLAEFEAVAGVVGVADDVINLVVVAEDDEGVAECVSAEGDAFGELIGAEVEVSGGE